MEGNTIKKASLTSQSAWLMFAKTVGFVLSFILPLVIYRRLSQTEAGIYKQIFLVLGTANIILPMGVSMSAYYFLSREVEKRPFYITNILIFNFVAGALACLALFIYPQFLGNLFQDAEMTRLAPTLGVVIWLWIFSTFLETVAVANQEARLATAFIILSQLTKTLLMISAVLIFGSVNALLYAAMIQAFIQTFILFIYLKSRFAGFWRKFDLNLFIAHLKYAIPFGLAGTLWFLQSEGHNYFVGYKFSPAEMAIYAIGCFELPLLTMLVESISSVLIPRMSQLQMADKRREMIELTARATEKLAFFYFPIYAYFVVVAEDFITTLFTRAYLESVPIFLINITLLLFFIWITDPIVRAYAHLGRFILKLRIFIVIGLFTVLWFGIDYFDLRGMILAVVITAIVERIIATFVAWRTVGVKFSDYVLLKNVGKTAVSALIAGAAAFFFHRQFRPFAALPVDFINEFFSLNLPEKVSNFLTGILILSATGILFAGIYLFTANFFGTISFEDKIMLRNFLANFTKFFRRKSAEKLNDKLTKGNPLPTDN